MENYKYSRKKKPTNSSLSLSLSLSVGVKRSSSQAVKQSSRVARYFHSTLISLDAWNTIPDAQQDNATILTILTASVLFNYNPGESTGCI